MGVRKVMAAAGKRLRRIKKTASGMKAVRTWSGAAGLFYGELPAPPFLYEGIEDFP